MIARANWIFFWYYAGSTISYIALMILAICYIKRHTEYTVVRNLALSRLLIPRVTIIAPAKNEEACILGAARAFLEQLRTKDVTIAQVIQLRMVLLEKHHCEQTLANIRNHSGAGQGAH